MSKILFSDLDGTLLDDKKHISEANKKAIQKMLEDGNYFVICTGRPVSSGRIVAKALELNTPGCYMICFNGSLVYDCSSDRVLTKHSVMIHDVVRLFEAAKKAGIHIQTYNDTDIITLAHTKELDYYLAHTNMTYKVVDNILNALTVEPQKVLMIDLKCRGRLEKFQKDNRSWTDKSMNSFFSFPQYLEYCPKGIDKAFGVEYLAHFLNIPIENTIAVGDERNDLRMIQKAHIGIAMANAHEEVLKAAGYVTERDNNHDALAEVIERFL